jgi:hypothetical protein
LNRDLNRATVIFQPSLTRLEDEPRCYRALKRAAKIKRRSATKKELSRKCLSNDNALKRPATFRRHYHGIGSEQLPLFSP